MSRPFSVKKPGAVRRVSDPLLGNVAFYELLTAHGRDR